MQNDEKKSLLESLLFISGDALGVSELAKITSLPQEEVVEALGSLAEDYRRRKGGVMIVEIAEGWQMVSNPVYSYWIKKLGKTKSAGRLSIAALETLAIVAYKQPITKAELEQIRSVGADWTIKILLERKLIDILGRKDAPGKPILFGTTKEFLRHFGLKNITELPTLREFTKEE
jgi:segregation and condensation protein B